MTADMSMMNRLKGFRKKRKHELGLPSSGEPVFFISAPQIWSAHVESYLEERGIPYLKAGQKGAALALELGYVNEVFDYYIPPGALDLALEEAGDLGEIVRG